MNQIPGKVVLFLGNIFLDLPVIQYLQNVTAELKHSTYTYSEGQGFSHAFQKKKKKGGVDSPLLYAIICSSVVTATSVDILNIYTCLIEK